MKIIQVTNPGPSSAITIGECADPVAGDSEVVIKVCAAGVNRADLLQRAGKYPPPPGTPDILGLEVSGEISAVGKGVTEWKVGDEVCALLAGGGYAEKVSVPQGQVMRRPTRVSLIEAAAIPEAFLTAYTNLFVEGTLSRGERVLIHGGASGVGTAALQLARHRGAVPACTVGDDSKSAKCRALGAAAVFNYRAAPFAEEVMRWSPTGVDLVLDIVGRDYLSGNLSVLAQKGRLVCIATMSGARGELDLSVLMRKRARVIGSVLRTRSIEEKASLVSGFSASLLPLFDTGELSPVVHSVFSFTEVERAHEVMRSSGHIGKILLRW
jgi:putative PIG3 family NAD(P)H quinone oxidoreductase